MARAADVSVATVSRALNGIDKVAGITRERVLKIVHELDYVPHSGARALSTRRTETIGVLLPDLHGEYFSELIRGIDLAARQHGLHLLLSSSHGDPTEAAAALRAMRSRVDSIIVMLPSAGEELLVHSRKGPVPMVFLGSGDHRDHPSFEIDNYGGAVAITRHLLDSGRRGIAFVAGPLDNREARERERGYRAAIASAGGDEWIVAGDFSEQSGRDAAAQFIAGPRPDAIFCANDMMAIGCLESLREAGLRIPDDIALAGFDDIPIARYVSPALTTAAVPIAAIGRRALECCVELIAGRKTKRRHVIQPELVVRSSTQRRPTDR
ncbi:LacI family DNA-binding transcriptional regulator [Sphingomonas sp.]|uniref:LacI family DNA-binding transcriptional regulator n=1 Tax=Sphingomonas sp. TaxID=28214 RepID=UPI0025ED7E18|nr:LacI family DNA-binding transcriptional regulator [Sphingomonas sp.]